MYLVCLWSLRYILVLFLFNFFRVYEVCLAWIATMLCYPWFLLFRYVISYHISESMTCRNMYPSFLEFCWRNLWTIFQQVSKELAVRMHSEMVTLQTMDSIFYELQRQGRISFYLTTSGEEAVNIASAAALSSHDVILPQVCFFPKALKFPHSSSQIHFQIFYFAILHFC